VRIGRALALVLITALSACGTAPPEAAGPPATSATAARPGADRILTAIAAKWPVPHQRDNTAACAAKAESVALGCVRLITTDTVSVYEFADPATAQYWIDQMQFTGDWRPAGRFALAWTERRQRLTPTATRAGMVKIATATAAGLESAY
jgi:hypothetical protein